MADFELSILNGLDCVRGQGGGAAGRGVAGTLPAGVELQDGAGHAVQRQYLVDRA